MIRAECAIFFSMMLCGMAATAVATLFLTLGSASKVARAVFDFLTPIVVGVFFFFSLYISSSGVFRLYALLAFLIGGAVFRALYRRFRPTLKRILCRMIVPIKSLEKAISERLEPLRRHIASKRAAARERRKEKRRIRVELGVKRREERTARRLEKKARREHLKKLAAYRRDVALATKKERCTRAKKSLIS